MALRNRRSVLLAKIESPSGTDAAPSGTDAVRCENPRFVATPDVVTTNEVNGSLDSDEPIIGGIKASVTFDVYMVGSGTPETAPEWGKLLRACGWAETITSTAVPSSAAALGSGASTTAATLGAAATGTDDLYNGMPLDISSTVTLSTFIADYTSGKVATLTDTASGTLTTTSNYQIPKNTVYRPASSSIPSLTLWLYKDGKLYKGVGARGTFSFTLTNAGTGKFSFTFSAIWSSNSDASVVTPTYQANATKPIFRGGHMRWNRILCQVRTLTLDNGATVAYIDNPEAAQGFDPAEHSGREMMATIDPYETVVATRDIFADMAAGTKRIVHARLGSTTGNKFGITIPEGMAMQNDQSGDRDGFAVESVNIRCVGADSGAYICQY